MLSVEFRHINNVLSVRRFTADDDPLLHKGFVERISDRDSEGFELTWKEGEGEPKNKFT